MADSSWTPEQLFKACCDRDESAWAEFRRRYGDHIRGVTYRVARRWGCLHLFEDFEQDIYAKLCANDFSPLRRFAPHHENSDIAYIRVLTANEVVGLCRRVNCRPDQTGQALPIEDGGAVHASSDGGFEVSLLLTEAEARLRQELPPRNIDRDLTVFRSYYLLGLTAAQISTLPSVGLVAAGVESLLYRCRQILTQQKDNSQKGNSGPGRYRKQDTGA